MAEILKVPVIVLKHKDKEGRYLANGIEFADFSDPDGDVTIENIEGAFMIVRRDYQTPGQKEIDEKLGESEFHKSYMKDQYGENAFVSFDLAKWLETYEPVNIEISVEQYNIAAEFNEWSLVGEGNG